MNPSSAPTSLIRIFAKLVARCATALALYLSGAVSLRAASVRDLGLKGDGVADDTAALQSALASGQVDLEFPAGTYLLGTIELPDDTVLRFATTARVKVEPSKIKELPSASGKAMETSLPLFVLKGSRIRVDGLDAEGVFAAKGKDARNRPRDAVNVLLYGEDVADLEFSHLRAVAAEKKVKGAPDVIELKNCRNVTLADSTFEKIQHALLTDTCQNVSVHGNRAIQCNSITTFTRGEYLRHYDNWSRQVTYQCVFRGGSPDPSRKAPAVPLGSSDKVIRGLDPKQEGYSPHLAGAYDIQISHNYCEYGRTMAWGNKGRDVLFEGNVSRFTTDYAYGVEGCENVVFANNIAINARSAGIMTMYWADKVTVTGNQVIVRDEPYNPEYGAFPTQKGYQGGLLRFHHGPTTKEDTAAGSRYGAGQVIVSGNLLVNELHDQVRSIRVEGGRDVQISGNRIVNGWVFKSGDGRNKDDGGTISITGNEFVSDMPVAHSCIGVGGGVEQALVKNNNLRYARGGAAATPLREVVPSGKDEAVPAQPEEAQRAALPAISNLSGHPAQTLILVEGNTIQGWAQAIALESVTRTTEPLRLVVRDNSVDGAIQITGRPDSYRCAVTNNLDLKTLEPVPATLVKEEPAAK